ncbi:hypothetical protein IJF86_00030 [Candidatus Saccharibacteria bacterium]|nr:hypothetical protein [Candidatus Saccharibacteria bacterium]
MVKLLGKFYDATIKRDNSASEHYVAKQLSVSSLDIIFIAIRDSPEPLQSIIKIFYEGAAVFETLLYRNIPFVEIIELEKGSWADILKIVYETMMEEKSSFLA